MSASDFQLSRNEYAPRMPEELVKEAIHLFKVPSTSYNEKSMTIHIVHELNKMDIPYHIDSYGNIFATKGSSPWACFCAHLDTVHMYKNGFNVKVVQKQDRIHLHSVDDNNKSVGIGGDDKCGVFACLYLIKMLKNVRVIFFVREESGGLGSSNIDTNVFTGCKFLGGIDRWNGHDFINKYSGEFTISAEFKTAVEPYMRLRGYSFNSGLFTDSFNAQSRKIGISCFNLSCGYYAHHSDNEYVDLSELYNACLLAYEIGWLPDSFPYDLPERKYNVYNAQSGRTWDENNRYRDWGDWQWVKDDKKQLVRAPKEKEAEKKKNWWWTKAKDTTPRRVVYQGDVCICCGIQLLDHEHRYCVVCKPYFENRYPTEGFYD